MPRGACPESISCRGLVGRDRRAISVLHSTSGSGVSGFHPRKADRSAVTPALARPLDGTKPRRASPHGVVGRLERNPFLYIVAVCPRRFPANAAHEEPCDTRNENAPADYSAPQVHLQGIDPAPAGTGFASKKIGPSCLKTGRAANRSLETRSIACVGEEQPNRRWPAATAKPARERRCRAASRSPCCPGYLRSRR